MKGKRVSTILIIFVLMFVVGVIKAEVGMAADKYVLFNGRKIYYGTGGSSAGRVRGVPVRVAYDVANSQAAPPVSLSDERKTDDSTPSTSERQSAGFTGGSREYTIRIYGRGNRPEYIIYSHGGTAGIKRGYTLPRVDYSKFSNSAASSPGGKAADSKSNEALDNNYDGDYQPTAAELEMIRLINEEREKAGIAPLEIDYRLCALARAKSEDMMKNGYFSHTSPTYGSPFEMMKDHGIHYMAAGENIAKSISVMSAHSAFMNSEGHRRNILNPYFTHVGVGIAGGRYYTQMFISK